MDDYFYPYPVNGMDFPDNVSFAAYGRGFTNKADWRRDNVNVLIKEIHETVRQCKPWVKFGVSPFGIYRNKKSDPNGSNTNGLQNYDDLYADVLLWVNNGWVDYNIPQVYWEIGHPAADYDTLVRWWAKHSAARPLYIGQDVMRTVLPPLWWTIRVIIATCWKRFITNILPSSPVIRLWTTRLRKRCAR